MKFFKGLILAVTAVAVVAGGNVLAEAGATDNCPAGRGCFYDHAGFVGLLATKKGGEGASNVAGRVNDKMSSWNNRTNSNGRWYPHRDSSGLCHNMRAGWSQGYVGREFNDRLTTWAMNGGCS